MGKHNTSMEPRRYRSGEAARLARMPAATLRIWERRYAVVSPPKTPSGQRLYSDDDLQRLRLIKTLVDQGHPISASAVFPVSAYWDASSMEPARMQMRMLPNADPALGMSAGPTTRRESVSGNSGGVLSRDSMSAFSASQSRPAIALMGCP